MSIDISSSDYKEEYACKNCRRLASNRDNCGEHTCPSEFINEYGNSWCFIPTDDYSKFSHDRTIRDICRRYSKDVLVEALDYLNKHEEEIKNDFRY